MPDPLGQFYLGFREAEQGEAVTFLCEKIKGILSENARRVPAAANRGSRDGEIFLYRAQMVEKTRRSS